MVGACFTASGRITCFSYPVGGKEGGEGSGGHAGRNGRTVGRAVSPQGPGVVGVHSQPVASPKDKDAGWACWDPSVPRCLLSVSDSLITEHILTLPGSVLSSLAE